MMSKLIISVQLTFIISKERGLSGRRGIHPAKHGERENMKKPEPIYCVKYNGFAEPVVGEFLNQVSP